MPDSITGNWNEVDEHDYYEDYDDYKRETYFQYHESGSRIQCWKDALISGFYWLKSKSKQLSRSRNRGEKDGIPF